jgi:hypothetical protein
MSVDARIRPMVFGYASCAERKVGHSDNLPIVTGIDERSVRVRAASPTSGSTLRDNATALKQTLRLSDAAGADGADDHKNIKALTVGALHSCSHCHNKYAPSMWLDLKYRLR